MLSTVLTLLSSARNSLFVDVGANIGFYALLVKACYGSDIKVVAYEPMPTLAASLRDLATENQLDISIDQAALSNASGTTKFYVSPISDCSNSLNPKFRNSDKSIDVKVKLLDEVSEAWIGAERTVVKIDTETTEPDVVEGGWNWISKVRPWIICEILPGSVDSRLIKLLTELHYVLYAIECNQLTEVPGSWTTNTGKTRDFLFAPQKIELDQLQYIRTLSNHLHISKNATAAKISSILTPEDAFKQLSSAASPSDFDLMGLTFMELGRREIPVSLPGPKAVISGAIVRSSGNLNRTLLALHCPTGSRSPAGFTWSDSGFYYRYINPLSDGLTFIEILDLTNIDINDIRLEFRDWYSTGRTFLSDIDIQPL